MSKYSRNYRRRKSKRKNSSKAVWAKLEYSPPIFIGKIPEIKKKLSYNEKLKDPRWKNRRHKIIERDHYACQECGSRLNLQVHHRKYIWGKEPWNYPDEDLITLCDICHTRRHLPIE